MGYTEPRTLPANVQRVRAALTDRHEVKIDDVRVFDQVRGPLISIVARWETEPEGGHNSLPFTHDVEVGRDDVDALVQLGAKRGDQCLRVEVDERRDVRAPSTWRVLRGTDELDRGSAADEDAARTAAFDAARRIDPTEAGAGPSPYPNAIT